MDYQRVFWNECEDRYGVQAYTELINERILLKGDLPAQTRERLLRVAHLCLVYKMMKEGTQIKTELIEGREVEG